MNRAQILRQNFLSVAVDQVREENILLFLEYKYTSVDLHYPETIFKLFIQFDSVALSDTRIKQAIATIFRYYLYNGEPVRFTGMFTVLSNNPELLQQKEVAEAARTGAFKLLSEGNYAGYLRRRTVFVDPLLDVDSSVLHEAGLGGIRSLLTDVYPLPWQDILNIAKEVSASKSEIRQCVVDVIVKKLLRGLGRYDFLQARVDIPFEFYPDTNLVIEQALQTAFADHSFQGSTLDEIIENCYRPNRMKPISELIRDPLKRLIADGIIHHACVIQQKYGKGNDTTQIWQSGMTNLIKDEQQIGVMLNNFGDIPPATFATPQLQYVRDYMQKIGLVSPQMFLDYQKVTGEGVKALQRFEDEAASMSAAMFTSEPTPETIAKHRFYKPVIETTYPNHSGKNTNYKLNESCSDRTTDLARFRFKPKYEIDLAEGIPMVLKQGTQVDTRTSERIQASIKSVQTAFEAVAFEPEKMLNWITQRVDAELAAHQLDIPLETLEEKIYLLVLEAVAGRLPAASLKEIMVGYQFATHEDIRGYMQGTQDRSQQSKNPGYSHLLELNEFFSDHLKETQRSIAKIALQSPAIQALTEKYWHEAQSLVSTTEKQRELSKLRPETLGLEGTLLTRIATQLERTANVREQKAGRVPTLFAKTESGEIAYDEAGDPILAEKGTAIKKMIEAEQKQIARAQTFASGQAEAPESVQISDYESSELLALLAKSESATMSEADFDQYVTAAFQSIFATELVRIAQETAKYELSRPLSGRNQTKLEAYFTKNKVSAHARGVGGVCVSGDTPGKTGSEKNQWDMPNYFQLVLKDPERRDAQGLILLHWYQFGTQRYLTAALNPSSTYLYRVDEELLFEKLTGVLEQFATDNQFDAVLVSKNPHIRTNRTGGTFEQAMNKRIAKVHKEVEFPTPEVFSYEPEYFQQKFDALWQRPAQATT